MEQMELLAPRYAAVVRNGASPRAEVPSFRR
jgi:hypothetical protein